MGNPNNCETCSNRQCEKLNSPKSGAWCYMFKDEPTAVCEQHTGRRMPSILLDLAQFLKATKGTG